ncbi:hypothetical protein IRJ41_020242, partial [Triplophysa rosa]
FILTGLLFSTSVPTRYYYYINARMSWAEAQSYCRMKHADLATADTKSHANRLLGIVNDGYKGSVWIGLKRGTQHQWGWSSGDNTLTEYSKWATVDLDHLCGYFSSGLWYNLSCSTPLHFVCYNESNAYFRFSSARNWRDAQSYCRQYHKDLATVKSAEEQAQLHALVGNGPSVWIGLFSNYWQWSDRWSLFFRNWATTQPVASCDCAAMSTADSGKWAAEVCDLKHPFICHGSPKIRLRKNHYLNETMTLIDARNYCRARFTDMATADTMNDVNSMMNTVDPGYNGSVWIGLLRILPARWVWPSDSTSVSQYSNWSPGEPNGNWECVKSLNGSWFDEDCALTLQFVCFNDSTGYVHINTPLTWRDAQNYCRQHHTELASVSSPEQQGLISNESSVWIGLFLDSWLWSDGSRLNFRYWKTGLPSAITETGICVAMSTTDSGKWAYHSCGQKLPIICYGDDKLIKKQLVRLNLSCGGKCKLSDTSLQTTILNETRICPTLRYNTKRTDKEQRKTQGIKGEAIRKENETPVGEREN